MVGGRCTVELSSRCVLEAAISHGEGIHAICFILCEMIKNPGGRRFCEGRHFNMKPIMKNR